MICLLITFLFPFSLWAQELPKITFDNYIRNDLRKEPESLGNQFQLRHKIRISYQITPELSAHSSLSSGSSYNSEWNTPGEENYDFNLRNLYLEYEKGNVRIQAGSIPTFKGYKSSLNLDKNGWIDKGVRFKFKHQSSIFELVAGSVDNVDAPEFFQRQSGDMNYLEFEVTKIIDPTTVLELGYDHLEENYLRGEVRKDFNFIRSHLLKLSVQGVYNTNQENIANSFEVLLKGGKNDSWTSQFDYTLRYVNVDQGFGQRGQLIDEFRFEGSQLTNILSFTPKKAKNLEFFLRTIHNVIKDDVNFDYRINGGLRWRLKSKKKKVVEERP